MNIIICGIVKNVEKYIETNIKTCLELSKKFDKSEIIIYENNSTDKSKKLLQKYKDQIKIISEDIEIKKENCKIWAYTEVTGSDHSCHIENIVNARNKLIDEIRKPKYNNYQLIVLIDLDSKGFDINGIIDSINIVDKNPEYVLYGNSPKYYDLFALRSPHSKYNLFGPELVGEIFWKTRSKEKIPLKDKLYEVYSAFNLNTNSIKLYEVYSAFNGIGVFSRSVFLMYKYDCIVNENTKKVYKELINKHKDFYNNLKVFIEKDCNTFNGGIKDDLIYWKKNSGYNNILICEHVNMNFNLLNDGYKIYINPKMMYYNSR